LIQFIFQREFIKEEVTDDKEGVFLSHMGGITDFWFYLKKSV